ncbi:uncharacterized protein Bfra_007234 [Botrytis fragariae]|uniref:Uncharacterized protein n=1 Tax=Botrytis fragariae TaxID=1964551 RepID=A0A8H6AIM8_9HELO|nr:uncharacterized protein Bfra_007234 [Botrytis fragariae]KAF5868039.1 hypothetical protein Bfra_007234 [Botrytis fragariae]
MRSYNMLDIWEEILGYFGPADHQPRSQLVRCVFDKVLLVVGLSPLAVGFIVGCTFFAITAIAAFPLFIAAVGMMLVSDSVAVSLENVYRTIKRWTSRMWCGILGNRKDLTTDQLPTTNTPQTKFSTKQSPVSSLASNIFIDTMNDERKFALHSNPVTTMKYILSDPAPVFPSPCAEIKGRSKERNSQVTALPPPPYN